MKITNEEAMKMLKEFAIVDAIQEDYDVIAVAIWALEKQIPKEPIKLKAMTYKRCPVCKNNVETLMGQHGYCPSCGQKIDWGEV